MFAPPRILPAFLVLALLVPSQAEARRRGGGWGPEQAIASLFGFRLYSAPAPRSSPARRARRPAPVREAPPSAVASAPDAATRPTMAANAMPPSAPIREPTPPLAVASSAMPAVNASASAAPRAPAAPLQPLAPAPTARAADRVSPAMDRGTWIEPVR